VFAWQVICTFRAGGRVWSRRRSLPMELLMPNHPSRPVEAGDAVLPLRPHAGYASDYSGRGPKNYRRPDDLIHDDIAERLTVDPLIDAVEVEIDVRSGEVTLSGLVPTRDQRRRAEVIAERVGGVRHVTNTIRVPDGLLARPPILERHRG